MAEDTDNAPAAAPAKARKPGKRKTPGQSVAATRMVKQAKRKGFGRDAGEGIVFFAGAERKRSKAGKDKFTCTFAAQAFSINVSADVPVDVASHALLVYWRNTILSGTKPDGSGAQVKLSQATLAKADTGERLTPYRGAATGQLADGLRRTEITGTTTRARCTILPPTNRNVFVATELARGIKYMTLGGEADEVIAAAVQQWLKAAIDDKARAANPEPLTAEKADA